MENTKSTQSKAQNLKAPVKKPYIIDNDSNLKAESLIELNTENVLQGIIWSEILGKPRALRKGR